jgi:hypothetical protein
MPHPSILLAASTVAFVASQRRGASADTPDHDDQIVGAGVAALGR